MSTFHPFPRLPFELRARIWELTIEPRVIDISVPESPGFWGKPLRVSPTPVPAPLHTCQESRSELQRHYQRAFSELDDSNSAFFRYVWVNFDIDIINVGSGWNFDYYRAVAPMIERLQFDGDNSDSGFYHSAMKDLRLFVSTREIYVVCTSTDDGGSCLNAWIGALEDHYWPCGTDNVWMIDSNDRKMTKGTVLEEMYEQDFRESSTQMGYDYKTGLPLDGTPD